MVARADNRRWDVLRGDPAAERELSSALRLPPLVCRVLVARGLGEPDQARAFLEPSLERDWADPLLIPGMGEACERVGRALDEGERIAVFGDFDVDGMSSTCLLTLALRRLGGDVHPYIPHRFGEGYGMSPAALERVIEGCHPDLIVTVDNGISSAKEVDWLRDRGIDVVITDHHEPGDLVPTGVPVTDPKLSPSCVSRELAGAGVALKMVCELGRRRGAPELWRAYTEVATLGTISDMMLLQGENRALVADGIEHMRHTSRPGMVALAATAGVDLASVTSDSLPFTLIPRLNAAGRMGTTDVAFDLLLTDDPAEATVLAGRLESTNDERRAIESELTKEATERIEATYDGGRVIVVGGEGWHEGVKGIVASRIVGRYHVPTILFSVSGEVARGSGRSVGSVDLFHAVEQCSDLLVRFGGHAGAVGVTCETSRMGDFRKRLEEVLDGLPAEQFQDRGEVTALVRLDEMTMGGIGSLEALQPFGQGNKRPLFGTRGVCMRNRARVGYSGNHLRFTATDGASSVAAIMFRAPEIERAVEWEGAVDLVFDAVNETWQGRTKPKLMVKDIIYRDGTDGTEGISDELFERAAASASGESLARGTSGTAGPQAPSGGAGVRQGLSGLSYEELTERLRERMIGGHALLPAQRLALERLALGRSTLCVMATGRGKSLIFHVHAAREALLRHRASVFVYPLRALVADQAYHLREALGEVGVEVRVLTGETAQDERDSTFSELASGEADVVLTTPEFLAIHARRFARGGRVGFVVVDEAHHAGTARGGDRSAYTKLPEVLEELGRPTVLAVTATAATPVAREVCRLAGIPEDGVVVDQSVRDNLSIVDHRGLRERDVALVSLVASGEKTVVYVNSRDQSVSLARMLRHDIPELGHRIAFYNAGLDRGVRSRVEDSFRRGTLTCIVSTSAFGEGVNLPDIRNVVLYHLPFGATEFNQMSGRSGRDGKPAQVVLLFGSRDAHVNERVLDATSPARGELATLYRALMTLSRRATRVSGEGSFPLDGSDVARVACEIDPRRGVDERVVSCGVDIFRELGLLDVTGYGDGRRITMVEGASRVDLEGSVRFLEGHRARESFRDFCDWALSSTPQEMLSRINRPITPSFGRVVDR